MALCHSPLSILLTSVCFPLSLSLFSVGCHLLQLKRKKTLFVYIHPLLCWILLLLLWMIKALKGRDPVITFFFCFVFLFTVVYLGIWLFFFFIASNTSSSSLHFFLFQCLYLVFPYDVEGEGWWKGLMWLVWEQVEVALRGASGDIKRKFTLSLV